MRGVEQALEHVANMRRAAEATLQDCDRLESLLNVEAAKLGGEAVPDGPFRLSERSLSRLDGVHPDLLAVAHYAIRTSPYDFGIPETGGVRDEETQRRLVADGKSKTMRSRHRTGHAFDFYAFVSGAASWKTEHVLAVHDAIVSAARALDVPLRWGGDWDMDGVPRERGENDLVHHELPRAVYGDDAHSRSEKAARFLASLA